MNKDKFDNTIDTIITILIELKKIAFSIDNDKENNDQDKLLSRKEAAEILGIAYGTLCIWECRKTHKIPSIKIGHHVKYRKKDLINFLNERSRNMNFEQ